MYIHSQKSSTMLILASAVCTTNCSLLIVRLSGWRDMWAHFQVSPLSNYSFISWRTSCARLRSATQNFCVLLFSIVSRESLSAALQGASPRLLPLCVELHLKCCNTKIEQTAWNETCGDYSYTYWDTGKSHMNKRWRKKKPPQYLYIVWQKFEFAPHRSPAHNPAHRGC